LRVAWSPDSLRISAGSADKFLYIWDAETTKISYKLPGHLGSVNDVDFHPIEPISMFLKIILTFTILISILFQSCIGIK